MNTINETVLAVSEHGGPWMHDGYGGGPWFLLIPLFWIAVVIAIVTFVRRRGGPWHRHHGAEGVLRERYARGEVTEQEFRERLQVLRGK